MTQFSSQGLEMARSNISFNDLRTKSRLSSTYLKYLRPTRLIILCHVRHKTSKPNDMYNLVLEKLQNCITNKTEKKSYKSKFQNQR